MNAYLTFLGCRLNEAELQIWADDFASQGIAMTASPEEADLMVVNTCAVTREAARKSRQSIRKLHRNNERAKLVVTGCYASLEPDEAGELLGVDLVVPNSQKDQLATKSKALLELPDMPFAAAEPDAAALFARNRERAFIKVQDGCRYRCTYCIVTVARGEEVSRSEASIIAEVNRLHENGVKEIVLAGVHVGGYGSDIGSSLTELVKRLLAETKIPRIRFASVEPWDLAEDFFELFSNKRLMPHMHLPVQSGSDSILRKMSRRCKRESFLNLVNRAKKNVAGFNVTTDIIVGFPGETEDDFELSKSIVEAAGFGHVHIFSFSPREGTKAAGLENQIEDEVKKSRSKILHQVAANCRLRQLNEQPGNECSVLWEGKAEKMPSGKFRFSGYSENYYKVVVELETELNISNQILRTKIRSVDQEQGLLIGQLIEEPQPDKLMVSVEN